MSAQVSTHQPGLITLSPLDEARFGVRSARCPGVTPEKLPAIIEECRAHQIVFLIARCVTTDIAAAQAMERAGFLLMDTLVYYSRNVQKAPVPEWTDKVPVRRMQPGEERALGEVAAAAFEGYLSHYHADSRLDPADCDAGYVQWAQHLGASRSEDGEVFVAEHQGEIVGFAAVRLNSPLEGDGVLFALHPRAEGLGIYHSFMVHAMHWCRTRGARRMIISTQITNVAVQKAWTQLGFEPSYSYYTFHKWFDES
jgi:GNAT superfamily N-acetyltransferase